MSCLVKIQKFGRNSENLVEALKIHGNTTKTYPFPNEEINRKGWAGTEDCPGSLWIVRTVSGLSGQFLDCPDSFWIVHRIFRLSGQFLDCPDSF